MLCMYTHAHARARTHTHTHTHTHTQNFYARDCLYAHIRDNVLQQCVILTREWDICESRYIIRFYASR